MIVHVLGGNFPAGAQRCSGQESRRPAEMAAHLGLAKGVCVYMLLRCLLAVILWVSPFSTENSLWQSSVTKLFPLALSKYIW